MLEQGPGVFEPRLAGNAAFFSCARNEALHGSLVQVCHRQPRNRGVVPALPLLAQQERVERGSLEQLIGGSSAHVVAAPAAHGECLRLHVDFEILTERVVHQPHGGNDAQNRGDLVRDILE